MWVTKYFSKSSSVSDSEPAAVPSASCNWEMPRWVSVGTRSVSYLQILPRQIVFAKLRFSALARFPSQWQNSFAWPSWTCQNTCSNFNKGSYAHMSLRLIDYQLSSAHVSKLFRDNFDITMGRAEIFLLALFSSSLFTKVFECSSFSRCHFTWFFISLFWSTFFLGKLWDCG